MAPPSILMIDSLKVKLSELDLDAGTQAANERRVVGSCRAKVGEYGERIGEYTVRLSQPDNITIANMIDKITSY